MEWLSASSCSAAYKFGWLVGTASGLYAMAIIFVLIASAPAYRADVELYISESARKNAQWILFSAQLLLIIAWVAGAWHVGRASRESVVCYVQTVPLGAVAVIAPVMLFLMFTAANWIGRSGAR